MSKVAIPVITSGNAEVDRFTQAAKQALDSITGQTQNSAKLMALTKDATPLQLVNLLNSVIKRLGEDGAGTFDTVSQFPVTADATAAAPPGAIMFFPFSTAPTGWIKANGALISRATYAALFAAANADGLVSEATWTATSTGRFSVGDGSTTFRIPDARGEFVRGFDDGRGVDGGRAYGTFQGDLFKTHVHNLTNALIAYNTGGGGAFWNGGSYGLSGINQDVSATGGAETRPRNVAWLACIKY